MKIPGATTLLLAAALSVACASSPAPRGVAGNAQASPGPVVAGAPAPPPATRASMPAMLVGSVDRALVERAFPAWAAAVGESRPDPKAAAALLEVEPGPTVTVLLGTWCSDSRRELGRLWNAFDLAGGEPRFTLRYVAVDRAKREPAGEIAGRDLRFVPTFYVERDGREVGRIVEVSPHGIERDLLDLLTGARQGVISARTDLAP